MTPAAYLNPSFALAATKPLHGGVSGVDTASQSTERPRLLINPNAPVGGPVASFNSEFEHSPPKPLKPSAPTTVYPTKDDAIVTASSNPVSSYPKISKLTIPENCGGCGWKACAHHCAKLFQLEVEISGLSAKPVVEIPRKKDFAGKYKDKPGRLQCRMQYRCGDDNKETLLNLGVATIESGGEIQDPLTQEKHRVGLQYCKVGAHRTVQLEWHEGTGVDDSGGSTGTALVQFKVRARRIRQHKSSWEFKDDAGSGIRGKPHNSSAFRFWACLQRANLEVADSKPVDEMINTAIQGNCGLYMCQEVRVWSKGNCPGRTRKGNCNLTPPASAGVKSSITGVASISPREEACSSQQFSASLPAALPFIPITMPIRSMGIPMLPPVDNGRMQTNEAMYTQIGKRTFDQFQQSVTPFVSLLTAMPNKRAMPIKRAKCITNNLPYSDPNAPLYARPEQDDELAEIDFILGSLTKFDNSSSDDTYEKGEYSSSDDTSSSTSWSPLAFDVDSLNGA